jgi:NAD+ synthase (glutamine-hydrolysing)
VSFYNLYAHDFMRVAVCVPEVRVADPAFNAEQTVALMEEAARGDAALALFPELGLTAYSCEDLFHQDALLDAALEALREVVEASRKLELLALVGLPLRIDGALYNCAAAVQGGRLLGVTAKTYLPNYREFYELRQFTSGDRCRHRQLNLLGMDVPFGSSLLYRYADQPLAAVHVEICEDLWTPIPPSSYAALAGATILANLSASNITVGKDGYRHQLVGNQSARCIAGYLYSAAGFGESTTDLAWDGHGLVYENGVQLAQTERYALRSQVVYADIDLDRLVQDRMRQNSFSESATKHAEEIAAFRVVTVETRLPRDKRLPLDRLYERFPYVPADPATRDARCREVYDIQVQGLATRLRSIGSDKIVIGVSGGLDSSQALVVCARAMDLLDLPRTNILAYTMPGFATGERTLDQSWRLMRAIGATAEEIDIKPSCLQMLKDIDHPYARGEQVYDIAFENVQAGERTSHLFRLANRHHGLVVGTSDLSELALGWSTYGVGDHMAHYHVNASVPKTLIQFLLRYIVRTDAMGQEASAVIADVLDTEISPELVPGKKNGQPQQKTESAIGPYALQDFNLYYILRFGYRPRKVAFLAWQAWHDAESGTWPDTPPGQRMSYDIAAIKKWLGVFVERFFKTSQYKRSALPNAPKVGSGGSLSPRSDWRAPSDSDATTWRADLDRIPDR